MRLHRDERTYRHAPHAMAATDEDAREGFERVRQHWQEHGFGYHTVEQEGAVVGFGGVKRNPDPELNLYYRFFPETHGQGLAREAAREWVAWAVEWLPPVPVIAVAAQHNPASIATARTAGLSALGQRELPDDPPECGPSVLLRSPVVDIVGSESFDVATRDQVLDLWCATTEAGGAVGFLPGAPRSAIEGPLVAHEAQMASGDGVAVLLRAPNSGQVVALGWWVRPGNPLLWHRRTAYRVMTDPDQRGRNLGRLLMAAMHRAARADGAEIAELGVRGGYGTEVFYERCGYTETGRLPGGIRVAPGDDRDDISMARRL